MRPSSPAAGEALLTGHGLTPETYAPMIDRTPPDTVKGEFRRILSFIKDQALKQPTHDLYLESFCWMDGGGVILSCDIDALPGGGAVERPSAAVFDAIVRAERLVVIKGLLDAWPGLPPVAKGPPP